MKQLKLETNDKKTNINNNKKELKLRYPVQVSLRLMASAVHLVK